MPQKKDRPLPSPCTTLIAHRDGKDTIRLYSVPAHSLHRLSETRPFEGRFPTGFFSLFPGEQGGAVTIPDSGNSIVKLLKNTQIKASCFRK